MRCITKQNKKQVTPVQKPSITAKLLALKFNVSEDALQKKLDKLDIPLARK